MLLFTEPTVNSDENSWSESTSFVSADFCVETSLSHRRHLVSVQSVHDEGQRMAEIVSPTALDPGDEATSSFHLPPYYRWKHNGFSCEFTAEWRDSAASMAVSLRHLASLRSHPRSLVVDAEDGSAVAAIVIGTPGEAVHPDTNELALRVDWRGWHVVDVADSFDGPVKRVLATHTQVFRGQVPSTSTSPATS